MTFVIFGIPIHFCAHEAFMILAAIGSIPVIGIWLKNMILKLHKKKECEHDHAG